MNTADIEADLDHMSLKDRIIIGVIVAVEVITFVLGVAMLP